MPDWLSVRSAPIEAVEHGAEAASAHFEAGPWIGPRTYDRLSYPAIEVLPDQTERADPTNWRHSIVVNLYFKRDRELDYVEDVLHPLAAVLDETLTALERTECITNYHPSRIEDHAGELDNTAVLLVSVTLQCVTQVDPAEF